MTRQTPALKSTAWALLCAALVLSWQAPTVRRNYGGNWTALYCTGDKFSIPPALASENIYSFKQSYGWDGQFYHYISHDPFLADGMRRRSTIPGCATNES
ncbi:MAG TPA: hypothetical protein VN924_11245 [Bryobacteraceae bacterium]|nr:hypothetical protein [Bryobacteraceae bacterium]